MGFDKVFEPLGGVAPLARIARALAGRSYSIVVRSADIERARRLVEPDTALIANDAPERGMTHSLRLALAYVDPRLPVGVLLGDMPFVTDAHIGAVEALLAPSVDVAFPVDDAGRPGHPVIFAASARGALAAVPDGDTLRAARDDPRLHRATVVIHDARAFDDVDSPADWNRSDRMHP